LPPERKSVHHLISLVQPFVEFLDAAQDPNMSAEPTLDHILENHLDLLTAEVGVASGTAVAWEFFEDLEICLFWHTLSCMEKTTESTRCCICGQASPQATLEDRFGGLQILFWCKNCDKTMNLRRKTISKKKAHADHRL
jgi:hypothetical protein